ncbi:MAG: RNase H family protein, partial [Aureliella sp.]
MVAQPHYLLFCDTHHSDNQLGASGPAGGYVRSGGRWHFVLEQLDGPERLEAADSELSMNRERLALLSVVRGLEALEQPSQVTLVTTSRYVSRGLRYGLNTWRDSDYTWERFGEQRPVRNSDLWRRIDTALQFHGIKCRLIQSSQPSPSQLSPEPAVAWNSQSAPVNGLLPVTLPSEVLTPESKVAAQALRAQPHHVGKSANSRQSSALACDLRGTKNQWKSACASSRSDI